MHSGQKMYRLVLIILILANMAFIFFNSSLNANDSDHQSMIIATKLAPVLIQSYETMPVPQRAEALNDLNNLLRNIAHALEFVPLGCCVFLLCKDIFKDRFSKAPLFLLTQAFCFLYAVTDEAHQLSVAGRTFDWLDIAKDALGVTVGIVCALIIILSRAGSRQSKSAAK